jgi:hypothetical protein
VNDGGLCYWQTVGQWERFFKELKMGRHASEGGSFEEAPVGNHVARCVRLIDLGTHHGEFQGKPNTRNQVLFTWELCQELMKDGKPFTIGKFYTNSLSEKSNLRPDLEAWRGKTFSPEELARFDLQNVLGAPCMLQVVKNDKNKSVVASVASMPKGMKAPEPANTPTAFWIDEWDQEVFDSLPDGLKKMIHDSDEYKEMHGQPREAAMEGIQGMTDDVPFSNPYRGRLSYIV